MPLVASAWSRISPDQSGPRKRKINLAALAQDVAADVRHSPDTCQHARAARFDVAPNALCQALRKSGVTYQKQPFGPQRRTQALLTVTLFSANIDSDVFHAWATHDLIPRLPDAAAIVIDTAAFHKRADTKAAIETAGHRLEYLPPYAPDLNPIEHEWAQAKAIRRKTGRPTEQILKQNYMDRLYNLLFRWFAGFGIDDPVRGEMRPDISPVG